MTKPWDRRSTETDSAWIAFVAYRDLGPGRSVEAALASAGRPPGTRRFWERLQTRHEWTARAAAWDSHLDQRRQKGAEETAEAIGRRQAQLGRAMQGVAARGLDALAKNPARLGGQAVAALGRAGVEMERVGSGLPTGRLQHEGVPGGAPIHIEVDPVAAAIAADPEARAAAVKVLDALRRPTP